MRHVKELPTPVRTLLGALGVVPRAAGRRTRPGAGVARGAALASYLLFEQGYTRELMALGLADVLARRDEVLRFIAGTRAAQEAAPEAVPEAACRARDAAY